MALGITTVYALPRAGLEAGRKLQRRKDTPRLRSGAESASKTAEGVVRESFVDCVSGEWRGSLCRFNEAGEKLSLPHLYIPDAYKEWGMEMFDWQTQTSTSVKGATLMHRIQKLYSATGCECDSVASDAHMQQELREGCFSEDGSYLCITQEETERVQKCQLEGCFCHGEDSRKRIVLYLTALEGRWKINTVELYMEQKVGDFGTEVDVAEYGTRVKNVSDHPKTEFTPETLQELHSLKPHLSAEEAEALEQLLGSSSSLIALHDGAWSRVGWVVSPMIVI